MSFENSLEKRERQSNCELVQEGNTRVMRSIIFVIRSLVGGGSERVMLLLAEEFLRREYCVELVVFEGEVAYEIPEKLQVICLKNNSTNRIKRDIHWVRELRKIIQAHTDPCVISFLPKPNIYSIISSIGIKCKTIISERNDPRHNASRIINLLRKSIYPIASKVVFQTEDARTFFRHIEERKVAIIPNPIKKDLPERYDGEREKVFVNFCRLAPQKNLFMLIDAFEKVYKTRSGYSLEIYGEGNLEGELVEYIRKKGLSDSCSINSFRRDIHIKIARYSGFVSSSDYEGISNSMLEAMGIGLPVICTDCPCGGARTYISDGENGLLVEVGDSEGMAKKMIWVIDHPIEANAMGQRAVQICEKLSVANIFSLWKEIIEEG